MTVAVTQVASTTAATTLAAADGTRTSLAIANTDPNRLYWLLGSGTPSANNYTDYLDEGESVSFDGPDIVVAVQGVWAGDGSGHANVTTNTGPVSDTNGASITTYAQLKTTVANWLRPNSSATADMTARIPQYIGLGEVMIRRELHVRALDQAVAELEIEDGEATVPTGFQAVLSMTLLEEPYNQLTGLALDQVRQRAKWNQAAVTPRHYARAGSVFYFDSLKDTSVELFHRRNLTPLSADSDTNWLLSANPDVYLWASLACASVRLIDPRKDDFQAWFARSLDSIQKVERAMHSDIIRPMPNTICPP